MAFTEAEVETIREIALLGSYSETAALIAAVSLDLSPQAVTAREENLRVDIEIWPTVRTNINDLIPNANSELYIARKKKRQLIRWNTRIWLGLPPISEEELEMEAIENASSATGGAFSMGAIRMQTGRRPRGGSEL